MVVEWDRWYYLIYLLPMGLAFILLLASALLGGGDHDSDADAPGLETDGSDFEGGFEGDAGDFGDSLADGSALLEPDIEGPDLDLDGADPGGGDAAIPSLKGASYGSAGMGLLSFLGFGRAPLSILLQGFMLFWGAVGFYATRIAQESQPHPAVFVPVGMAAAGIGGLCGMKLIAAFASRFMKPMETYAIRKDDLIGEIGIVTYPVSQKMGRVHVYDRHGTLHIESCRTLPDSEPISRNEKVLLVKHDPHRDLYWVERSPV